MLVLCRRQNERILIDGGRISVKVIRIKYDDGSVQLGIEAPDDVSIDREEIHYSKQRTAKLNEGP